MTTLGKTLHSSFKVGSTLTTIRNGLPWDEDEQGIILAGAIGNPVGIPTLWFNEQGIIGNPISAITNLGSAGGNINTSGSTRPTLGIADAKQVPLYNGSNKHLDGGPALSQSIASGSYSVFIVFNQHTIHHSVSAGNLGHTMITDGDGAGGFFYPAAFDINGFYGGHSGSAGDFRTTSISMSLNTRYYAQTVFSGSTITVKCNGITRTLTGSGPVKDLSNQITMGRNYNSSDFYDGEIDEILVYNRALTATECSTNQTYLLTKWPDAIGT